MASFEATSTPIARTAVAVVARFSEPLASSAGRTAPDISAIRCTDDSLGDRHDPGRIGMSQPSAATRSRSRKYASAEKKNWVIA